MEQGDKLSLKEAAAYAGVSEGTMRTWAKDIPNIQRYPGGGYGISKDDLMGYLATKEVRRPGATRGVQLDPKVETEAPVAPPYLLQLLEEIKGEREGLKGELAFARERIRDVETQNRELLARNRELEGDLVSLTREIRELVFGGGKPGLSAWMTKVQPDRDSAKHEVHEAEEIPHTPSSKSPPVKAKVTAAPRKKAAGKPKTVKAKAVPKVKPTAKRKR